MGDIADEHVSMLYERDLDDGDDFADHFDAPTGYVAARAVHREPEVPLSVSRALGLPPGVSWDYVRRWQDNLPANRRTPTAPGAK